MATGSYVFSLASFVDEYYLNRTKFSINVYTAMCFFKDSKIQQHLYSA